MAWQVYQPTISAVQSMLNVKDYGAKGDGVTNDYTAIQAAINAAGAMGVSARGVDVYFPAGVYAIGQTISVPFNNVMLVGAGWQSTVLYATFTTTDILQIGNGSSKSGCGLTDISVWCSGARTTGASININAMNDCLIKNFVINNTFQGIYVQGTSIKVWIKQGEVNNINTTASAAGIKVLNGLAGDTYIKDIVMSNPPASKGTAGIHITQTGHASIFRCNITSCTKGLLIDPSTSQDVSYLFIDHSLFDSCGTHAAHFNATTAASSRIRSVMCVNAWFSGTTAAGSGIEFTATGGAICDGLSFIGCRILNNYNHGVTYGAAVANVSFTDCTIAGNGSQTINTYDGISVAANGSALCCINCKIGQCGTAGNQQRYAINVAAGTSANLMFEYNDCQPNGTLGNLGYINLGAITGGGNVFINNLPCVPRSFGNARTSATGAITTTDTLVTDNTAAFNRLMANAMRAGTKIRFVVHGTVTIANTLTGTFQWRVRAGTNNSTADGVVLDGGAVTSPTGTGTAVNFQLTVELTVRTIGASGTVYGHFIYNHDSTTIGFYARGVAVIAGTASAVNTTNANYWNLSVVGSANVSITVQTCSMEVVCS